MKPQLNIVGCTKAQQEAVESMLKRKGSLWGRIGCLHKYIFTGEEFLKVRKAHRTIKLHREKRLSLCA